MNFDVRYCSHHDTKGALQKLLGVKKVKHGGSLSGGSATGGSRSHGGMPSSISLDSLLEQPADAKPRGLYMHVPFCDRICSFCNMRRSLSQQNEVEAYGEHLIKEISRIKNTPYISSEPFEVLYFGGGTPSVFDTTMFRRLFTHIATSFPRTPHYEWTMETTLHNLNEEKIRVLNDCGVNRISVGIQSFTDRGRKLLKRTGDGAWAIKKLEALQRQFHGTLGIDIIYSWPNQTQSELQQDIDTIERLGIDSVSFYSLMIHQGSDLSNRIQEGMLTFEKTVAYDKALHNHFYQTMVDNGYELLELTKMVRPGADKYRYIDIRYKNADLFPLGTGAGGRVLGHGVYHMSSTMSMVQPPHREMDQYNLVTGLLQFGTYDAEAIGALLPEVSLKLIEETLRSYENLGLLKPCSETVTSAGARTLTADGLFWGNNIAVDLLTKLIQSTDGVSESEPA